MKGVCHNRSYEDVISDMESQMYTPVADIKKVFWQSTRKSPLSCASTATPWGNSCGGITDYTEYAYEELLYQGGFIWEYMDHGHRRD